MPEHVVAKKEVAAGTRAADVAEIEAHIVALSESANGRMSLTLDNGQVWRQLEADGHVAAKLGDVATLSHGLLGSYWLKVNGRGWKVTRIR